MFGRILLLGLCLVATVLPDGSPWTVATPALAVVPSQASTGAQPAASPAGPKADMAANPSPVRILIPRIGVNALIESRGLDSGRNMQTPTDFRHAAWYNLGPVPGAPGNALVNGHVSWWTGSAVFSRLGELRAGDSVTVIRGDGTRVTFKVTARTIVAANARVASLFAPSRKATLTLITCSGTWDPRIMSDTHRLLVSAVLA
jgi:LPXTG-site transpeptidase (sortase) family protein